MGKLRTGRAGERDDCAGDAVKERIAEVRNLVDGRFDTRSCEMEHLERPSVTRSRENTAISELLQAFRFENAKRVFIGNAA
jgi:hypothetical protein